MIASPDGFTPLVYENTTGGDGTASFTDGRGRATFSGLYVDKAGEGFVCRFVAFDTRGIGVAWVDSDPFDVETGSPHAIALSTPVGTIKGGSTFDTPPVVAVQVRDVFGTPARGPSRGPCLEPVSLAPRTRCDFNISSR